MNRWLLFVVWIMGCARPHYLVQGDSGPADPTAQALACLAQFASGPCLTYQWEKRPEGREFGSFIFKIFRPNRGDGSPVPVDPPYPVSIRLWMPDMGHGSTRVYVQQLDVGTYRAEHVRFSMAGHWEIQFQLKNGADVTDQANIPYSF